MVSEKGMSKTVFFSLLRNWHCISRESAPKLFSWIQRLSGNKLSFKPEYFTRHVDEKVHKRAQELFSVKVANVAVLVPKDDCTNVITPETHAHDEFCHFAVHFIFYNIVLFFNPPPPLFPKFWGDLVFVREALWHHFLQIAGPCVLLIFQSIYNLEKHKWFSHCTYKSNNACMRNEKLKGVQNQKLLVFLAPHVFVFCFWEWYCSHKKLFSLKCENILAFVRTLFFLFS